MPKELGLKGALFADAGTLFGYSGRTNFSAFTGNSYGCPGGPAVPTVTSVFNGTTLTVPFAQASCITVNDDKKIRTSVGASILWASPLGPIRFDYARALTKGQYDVVQSFRFTGGTSF